VTFKTPGTPDLTLNANPPAAGQDWQETTLQVTGGVASLRVVRLKALMLTFACSSTTGTRTPFFKLTLPDGGAVYLPAPLGLTANQVGWFTLGVGMPYTNGTNGLNVAMTIPLPDICFAQSPTAALSIQTSTNGILSGDQWGALSGYAAQGR
jgi:hypothetical protein